MSGARLAFAVFAFWIMAALLAPVFDRAAERVVLERVLLGPDVAGWLGYDDLGRDLAARVWVGASTALLVGVTVAVGAALLGTFVGVVAGWCGGGVELLMLRIMEIVQAFPGLLLAIALAGVLGPGTTNTVIALIAGGWVGYARLARALTRVVRARDHVGAATVLGTPVPSVLRRHVVPLIAAPLLVEATFGLGAAIIGEAGLSFLGLGVPPPVPSWGTMIHDGVAYLLIAPHVVLAPGLALMSIVMAVNILAERWRARLDVRGGTDPGAN